jgi:pimeloyl-ACP methyl ester carboxylesterase/DNA-binding CsgD family transcriptional regulator
MGQTSRQRIHYATTTDGVRLAWADAGSGPPLVKAANWMTHLEDEWQSPVWQHWMRFFSEHFRFIRHDERGCGMSDARTGTLSLDQWAADLDTVIEAAQPAEPVTLLGISQGATTCALYAVRHPERVARLILYGGYARGFALRDVTVVRTYRAMVDLVRIGWGQENPTFRQLFTSRFIPGGTPEQLQWFNELCRRTTTGEIAANLLEARAGVDVREILASVSVPTLVMHARGDEVQSVEEGRLLAAGIPGAEFIELDSRNHILLEHEPAWARFCDAVLEFARRDQPAPGEDPAFRSLSARERQILALIADGLSNAEIAGRLAISEKTARNHTSNVFDKLGVWSRAQAIVFARERGFGAVQAKE